MCFLTSKKLYFTGSRTVDREKKVECYNLETNDYDDVNDLNVGRCRHSSVGFNDRFVFVFGGFSNGEFLNSIERLDTHEPQGVWNLIETPPQFLPCIESGAVQSKVNEIMVFGGFTANQNAANHDNTISYAYKFTVDKTSGKFSDPLRKKMETRRPILLS